VIDFNILEQDACEKPLLTFSSRSDPAPRKFKQEAAQRASRAAALVHRSERGVFQFLRRRRYPGRPGFYRGRYNGGSIGACWTQTPIGPVWTCG
jgi:hypothetical protein